MAQEWDRNSTARTINSGMSNVAAPLTVPCSDRRSLSAYADAAMRNPFSIGALSGLAPKVV